MTDPLLDARELAAWAGVSEATVRRRLAGTPATEMEFRDGIPVQLWRLSDVEHLLTDRVPRLAQRDVEPIRHDEERLIDAANRLGLTQHRLRRKVDRLHGRWRYASAASHVVIVLRRDELRRLGLEQPDQPQTIEIAGIRFCPDRELLERREADFILGEPGADTGIGVPTRPDPREQEPPEPVSVTAVIAVLTQRRDAIGLALLVRFLQGGLVIPSTGRLTRESLLLDCIRRPGPGR